MQVQTKYYHVVHGHPGGKKLCCTRANYDSGLINCNNYRPPTRAGYGSEVLGQCGKTWASDCSPLKERVH